MKKFLVILTSVSIGLTQPIYSVFSSDFTFLWPPFRSHVLNALLIPVVFLLVPTLVLWLLYRGTRQIHRASGKVFLLAVMTVGCLLWGMRLFFLGTQSPVHSLLAVVVTGVVILIILVFFRRFFILLFTYAACFPALSTLVFAYQHHAHLTARVSPTWQAVQHTSPTPKAIPVFVIMFDELPSYILRTRSHGINEELYPNFSAFASGATWYINSTTGWSGTRITIHSMVSGWDLFKDYAGRQLPANVPNIFAFLSASHRVLVRESIRLVATEESLHQTHLPVPVRAVQFVKRVAMLYCVAVFPRDWIDIPNLDTLVQNERIDFGATQWHEVRAFEAYWRGFVQSLSTEKNQLAFFYSVFPHHPYMVGPDGGLIMIHPTLRPAGEGQEAIPARSRLRYHAASRSGSGETIVNLRRSLINQVRYTDHVLGELLKAIERKGLYDEALIIVMSDHGIGFTDSAQGRDNLSSRSPRHQLDSNMMNAADVLIIKYPHQQSGNIDRRHAKPYDVAPTILDVLGVDEPWKMDGVSLLVEGWPERKILFRPRNYRAPDMPMTELPEPENHHLAFQPFEPIESPWIGKATELLKLRQERSGALSYIAFETAFPWERGAEKVLVLSGFSVLDQEKRIPHQTYIAVNGTIAKAIRPSQYVKLPKHPKLTQAAWSATIPPSHLRVGKNIIRAFSPVDARETAFVEFRRPFIFQITQDRLNKLRLSVAKKRD